MHFFGLKTVLLQIQLSKMLEDAFFVLCESNTSFYVNEKAGILISRLGQAMICPQNFFLLLRNRNGTSKAIISNNTIKL